MTDFNIFSSSSSLLPPMLSIKKSKILGSRVVGIEFWSNLQIRLKDLATLKFNPSSRSPKLTKV